ncbi:MAG TPA: histidine kinase [Anaerolineales bacterium]|nr:histidine kinase [Anaerolineales bacterium]
MATTKPNRISTSDNKSAAILEEIDKDLAGTQAEAKEIDLLFKQSEGEVEKLTQRNATINAHLQQVQAQIDRIPAKDIRVAYDAALDAQQRLAVMRGQMEKLQNQREHLRRTRELLEKVRGEILNRESEEQVKRGPNISVEIMTQAQEAERQKLSRQMHDGPAQALSNFILQTEIALRLFQIDQEQARNELNSLKAAALSTFQKVRDFIFDLRPMMLDDLGLVPTIKRYASYLAEKTGIEVNVNVSGSERQLEHYLEVIVFRALQELLSNTALHNQANLIKVQLDLGDRQVRASVEDNGRGFDSQAIPDEAQLTVKAIRERMEWLGGTFEVDSVVGQGSRITFTIPAEGKTVNT